MEDDNKNIDWLKDALGMSETKEQKLERELKELLKKLDWLQEKINKLKEV